MEKIGEILNKKPQPKSLKPALANHLTEYACTRCHDAGWTYGESYNEVVRCVCKADDDKKERDEQYLRMCQLPDTDMCLQNFEPVDGMNEALAATKLLIKGDILWLTLIGGSDRGKTHLAVSACKEWLKECRPARYAFVPIMLDELRETYNPDSPISYHRLMQFFYNVPLLVLDDLGVEKGRDRQQQGNTWAMEKLETIVEYRYFNKMPLIITTNKPLNELSPRIASRLQRQERSKVVVLGGREYRLVRRG